MHINILLRRRRFRQTSIFNFNNLTIYMLLESMQSEGQNLLFWGCGFRQLSQDLNAYTRTKTSTYGLYYDIFLECCCSLMQRKTKGLKLSKSGDFNKYQQHFSSNFWLSWFQHSSIYSLGACCLHRGKEIVLPEWLQQYRGAMFNRKKCIIDQACYRLLGS